MQTRAVISKIQWIRDQVPESLEFILSGIDSEPEATRYDSIEVIVDMTRFSESISRDLDAVQIMKAFGLERLIDRQSFKEWIPIFHHLAIEMRREGASESRGPEYAPIDRITNAWKTMTQCAEPINLLTIPESMRKPSLPENFISFEVASVGEENTSLARLAKAANFAEEAYEVVCRVYQIKGNGRLDIVKVESGSDIKIDCKGLGEPIKHLKDLILEAWHKLRHKRTEEILEDSKAVLNSLAVIDQINSREQENSLSAEEAEQLRRRVVSSVCGLFESGAIIDEIPPQETVENTKLLSNFSPKLIPPPKTSGKAPAKKTTRRKSASKRKPTRRRTK
jgi:hypothetical protein